MPTMASRIRDAGVTDAIRSNVFWVGEKIQPYREAIADTGYDYMIYGAIIAVLVCILVYAARKLALSSATEAAAEETLEYSGWQNGTDYDEFLKRQYAL